jgi:hypothetical protein
MAESAQNAMTVTLATVECIAMNTERRAYRSDITDEQWQLLWPELERLSPESHLGQPRKVSLREVYNTIQYQARNGC